MYARTLNLRDTENENIQHSDSVHKYEVTFFFAMTREMLIHYCLCITVLVRNKKPSGGHQTAREPTVSTV
jgi:hypothetical protein